MIKRLFDKVKALALRIVLPLPEMAERDASVAGPLEQLAGRALLPTWSAMARIVAVLVLAFIVWANVAQLDEVAIAQGEVVPEGKVKTIQHLEGGIVREIYVQDGSEVKEGQPLLQLELPVTAMNRDEIQVRLDGLELQRARLLSEVNGTELKVPQVQSERQPQLVSAETRSYQARRSTLQSSLDVIKDQIEQRRLEIQELDTKQRALSNSLRLARERLAMSADLLKSGLMARMEHVQLEGQVEDLEGQLSSVKASIPRAQAAETEARQRLDEERQKYLRQAQADLATAELDIARNTQLMSQASDQQLRTQIISPTDGVVKNMHANTLGGVIRAGDPIMEIVPMHEKLLIEARLSPADRGYVMQGQTATVKISAYDYTTYGGLEGKVVMVAPDTSVVQDQDPYYRVLVETDRSWLGEGDLTDATVEKHSITAGMPATVEIHTGTRSVMHYLVKPVLKLRHEAFHER